VRGQLGNWLFYLDEIKSRKCKSKLLMFAKLSAEKVSETARKVFGKKKKKRVLMFSKFEAEKISSTKFQGILKEQK
jgi:hypothetical protein